MSPRICFAASVRDQICTPITADNFVAVMKKPFIQNICDQIKLLDQNDTDELARLKKQLPIVCFHAREFKNARRKNDNALPSGLAMLDIDHVEGVALDLANRMAKSVDLKQNAIAFIAVTPSGHGIRIVGERRPKESLPQAQQRIAQLFGVASYDACTKDLARASFVSPWSYVVYFNPALFVVPDLELLPDAQPVEVHTEPTPASSTPQPVPVSEQEKDYTRRVALALLELMGGNPTVGERNNIYYNLCRHLRTICAFSPDWLVSVVPDFALPLAERQATAASAVASARTVSKSYLLQQAVIKVKNAENAEDEVLETIEEPAAEVLPPLPKVLQKICQRVPEPYRPALIIACLPVLGTLATKIRFDYIYQQEQSFSFMSCIIAPPAAGKSFIRKPVRLLLQPIDAQDEVERQKEEEYKNALRAAKNAKQQPENPRPCPRNNGVNISIAKLLQLLSYSDGKHLIGIAEELDTLLKSEKAGVWSQKRDVYRLAFDNAMYGQNYMSDNSFSANVPVFYNLLLTGTPNAAARFFSDVEDGLVTRFCFAQLPDMFGADIPLFQNYTEAEQRYIVGVANSLIQADGKLYCPAVNRHIADWVRRKGEIALQEDSRAIDTLRKRAAVIGFRAGYLAFLLNDRRYSADVSRFALWVAEYVFRNQMELFGAKFEAAMQEQFDNRPFSRSTLSLLESLPAEFTLAELRQARTDRRLSVQRTALAVLIHRWTKKNLICQVEHNKYRKL